MKYLAAPLTLMATPAVAHHEVVVATSILPLMGGLSIIAASGTAMLLKWLRKK